MPTTSLQALKGRTIRCVLFDLGDTLWYRRDMEVWQQVETAANQRAIALVREHVEPYRLPDQNDIVLGIRLREAFDAQTRAMIRREPGREPDVALAAQEALAQLGWGRIERELGTAIFEALRIRIPESRLLLDDAFPTLLELRRRGFLLGVVTNRLWGGPLFQEDLRALGLLDYFEPATIAISADLGVRKPNAAIFMHTLKALNVAPEQAVMVGDSLRSDIVGAQALGIFAVWKPKPRIREEIRARLVTPGASGHSEQEPPSSRHLAEERPADLPPGLHITDDDYILAYTEKREQTLDASHAEEIRPDLIIENLSDLLDIFLKAGEQ